MYLDGPWCSIEMGASIVLCPAEDTAGASLIAEEACASIKFIHSSYELQLILMQLSLQQWGW